MGHQKRLHCGDDSFQDFERVKSTSDGLCRLIVSTSIRFVLTAVDQVRDL